MPAARLPLRKVAAAMRPPVSAAAAAAAGIHRPGSANSAPSPAARFSTAPARPARNQILSPIRNADAFTTHLALSSSSRTPLLTLWTASWCSTCHATVLPLLSDLVASGVGESHGGVALAAVEMDAPDLAGSASSYDNLALTYMITAVPTLLSFDAGEAQVASKVTDARKLADRRFLEQWIVNEARRRGSRGGAGGGGGGGGGGAGGAGSLTAIFGGLFGLGR